jgi:hypothetical protein
MPLQQIIPTWFALNGCNDISPSGLNDIRTGAPVFAGGLNIGDYFDLTEQEAREHSYEVTGILHSGRYRRVQIHPQANDQNVEKGRILWMVTALIPDVNIVTTSNNGLVGVRPVVVLNDVEPGNYCFIQELGVASIRMGGSGTIGQMVAPGSSGTATVATETTEGNVIGKLLQAASNNQTALVLLELPVVQG